MSNSKNLQTDAGSIAFEGLYDPVGHQFVAKQAGTTSSDSGNESAPQMVQNYVATSNTALSSPPSNTTAATDTLLTFSAQINHWCLQNNSSQIVYYNLDAAASTGTFVLQPGGQ